MGHPRYLFLFILMICLFNGMYAKAVSAESYTYPQLTAEAAVLMDAKTGQVLFEKNLNEKYHPASITKIMTGMLALEKGYLGDVVTMSHEAVFSIGRNSSHIALDVDEVLTLEQALYAIAIASGNDAANGIAEHIAGCLEGFAQLMNERARQCGAENTSFVNAHGLSDEDHYTTAYDMGKIMMAALKIPLFPEVFNEVRYEILPTNKQDEIRYLHSRNSMVNGKYGYEGITASKSGWTSLANHTLVTAAKQGDRELIVVVMNNQSRDNNYADTVKLFDYGFGDFVDIRVDVRGLYSPRRELNFNLEEENLVRLLHQSLSYDDLKISYAFQERGDEITQAIISLNVKEPQKFMYEDLGCVFIDVETVTGDMTGAEMIAPANTDANSYTAKTYLLAGIGLICFLYVPLVFVKRRIDVKRNSLRLYQKYRF